MNNFGFTISKGRQIDYESNDSTKFSLRELQILIKRGENEEVRQNIRKCMLCGKCTLVCPRGVNTRNVVTLAKQAFQKYEEYAI